MDHLVALAACAQQGPALGWGAQERRSKSKDGYQSPHPFISTYLLSPYLERRGKMKKRRKKGAAGGRTLALKELEG